MLDTIQPLHDLGREREGDRDSSDLPDPRTRSRDVGMPHVVPRLRYGREDNRRRETEKRQEDRRLMAE